MKERLLGTRLKQRKAGARHWSSCKRYAVLISRVLHPVCEKPCLVLARSWGPLHACFVLHNFSWAFWSTLISEDCTPDSYCMFWKDNMPTLECWHAAHDVSVRFLILCTEGLQRRRAITQSLWVLLKTNKQSCCTAQVTRSCVTKACWYPPVSNKAKIQQILILSTPMKKTFFRSAQYLCCVLVWTLIATHLRHGLML